jgi:VWFA-related protein
MLPRSNNLRLARSGGTRAQRISTAGILGAAVLVLLAGIALDRSALAQNAPAAPPAKTQVPEQDDVAVFTTDTRLVVVHASVLDKNGKLVTNLAEPAFKVYENGVEQPLKVFRREDIPVSMGVVIDNSGSMRDKRAKVGAAALDLIRASNPQDEVFVVNFNDDAYLDQSMTSDIKKLEEALERYDTKGGTAMRDAISMSIDYTKEKGKKDKKVLVVITDGNDNTSMVNLEELVRKAQQSDVLIYLIGIFNEEEPREAKKAKRALHDLAIASGGMDYYPKDIEEIDRVTPQIAKEIRNQYTLAYSPTNQNLDGTFRKIQVTVNASGKPTVRTRNGYYARASASAQNR